MTSTFESGGLFETMLVVGGYVALEHQHYERISSAARAIGATELDDETWSAAIGTTIRAHEGGVHGLRCIYRRSSDGRWTLSAERFDLPAITTARREHGRVMLLPPEVRRASPEVKSLAWLERVRSLRDRLPRSVDEALLTTADSFVLEGTSTNVFAIRESALVTPPLSAGILPGIVRDWVIRSSSQLGLTVQYRMLDREDLLLGSFLTSSLSRLSSIRRVNGEAAADPGEAFQRLARLFDQEIGMMNDER